MKAISIHVGNQTLSCEDISVREPGFGVPEIRAVLQSVLEIEIEDFIDLFETDYDLFVNEARHELDPVPQFLAGINFPRLRDLIFQHEKELELFFKEYLLVDFLTEALNRKEKQAKYILNQIEAIKRENGAIRIVGLSFLRDS